jgi:FAD/FMN-containing dehydrogenase
MWPKADVVAGEKAARAERVLFERVVALEGSISGEHGIGFAKRPHIGLELAPDEIALMKRLKLAFDPHGILNPGKIFPD